MTFLGSEKAASEVIGHIIVLGLTMTGISLISLVGIPTIYELQDMANVRNAEQAFTVMDSRVSAVVLGNSPVQLLDVNLGGGTFAVEENETGKESYIQVNIVTDGGSEYITSPMGKIRYHLGDRIVAYEGGGVWSKYPSGGSVMLSPPEFHYNGVTLTLPVINVSGTGSIGGAGSTTIKFVKGSGPIITYPDASNPNRTNPVNSSGDSKVYVNITSEFYDAWADYANNLGYTVVTEDETNSSVYIELTVVPKSLGLNTSITNPISIRGVDPDDPAPIIELNVRFEAMDSQGFNSLNWQLTRQSGNKKWIVHLDGAADNKADIGIAYEDTSHPGDYAEIWMKKDAFQVIGSGASAYMDVDLLNQSINLTYKDNTNVGVDKGTCSKIQSNEFNDTAWTWSGVTENDEKSLYDIMQHYASLFAPNINLERCSPGGSDPVDYGDSVMLLNYTAHGALTYLHISDNIAEVSIT